MDDYQPFYGRRNFLDDECQPVGLDTGPLVDTSDRVEFTMPSPSLVETPRVSRLGGPTLEDILVSGGIIPEIEPTNSSSADGGFFFAPLGKVTTEPTMLPPQFSCFYDGSGGIILPPIAQDAGNQVLPPFPFIQNFGFLSIPNPGQMSLQNTFAMPQSPETENVEYVENYLQYPRTNITTSIDDLESEESSEEPDDPTDQDFFVDEEDLDDDEDDTKTTKMKKRKSRPKKKKKKKKKPKKKKKKKRKAKTAPTTTRKKTRGRQKKKNENKEYGIPNGTKHEPVASFNLKSKKEREKHLEEAAYAADGPISPPPPPPPRLYPRECFDANPFSAEKYALSDEKLRSLPMPKKPAPPKEIVQFAVRVMREGSAFTSNFPEKMSCFPYKYELRIRSSIGNLNANDVKLTNRGVKLHISGWICIPFNTFLWEYKCEVQFTSKVYQRKNRSFRFRVKKSGVLIGRTDSMEIGSKRGGTERSHWKDQKPKRKRSRRDLEEEEEEEVVSDIRVPGSRRSRRLKHKGRVNYIEKHVIGEGLGENEPPKKKRKVED